MLACKQRRYHTRVILLQHLLYLKRCHFQENNAQPNYSLAMITCMYHKEVDLGVFKKHFWLPQKSTEARKKTDSLHWMACFARLKRMVARSVLNSMYVILKNWGMPVQLLLRKLLLSLRKVMKMFADHFPFCMVLDC